MSTGKHRSTGPVEHLFDKSLGNAFRAIGTWSRASADLMWSAKSLGNADSKKCIHAVTTLSVETGPKRGASPNWAISEAGN